MPPQLLGIPGDNTYSNLAEARLAFWEQTVLPMVGNLVDELNHWLCPRYNGGIELEADLDNVPALAPRRYETWDRINSASFLSPEEKRAILKV